MKNLEFLTENEVWCKLTSLKYSLQNEIRNKMGMNVNVEVVELDMKDIQVRRSFKVMIMTQNQLSQNFLVKETNGGEWWWQDAGRSFAGFNVEV